MLITYNERRCEDVIEVPAAKFYSAMIAVYKFGLFKALLD
jgi:hypothetical protein